MRQRTIVSWISNWGKVLKSSKSFPEGPLSTLIISLFLEQNYKMSKNCVSNHQKERNKVFKLDLEKF